MIRQTIDITLSAAANAQRMNENFEELYGGQGGTSSKKLKILVVANSHGFDCWSYVPFILKEYGVDIELGLFYKAGQGIDGHYTNYSTGEAYADGANNPRLMYIDTATDTAWQVAFQSISGGENASVQRAVKYAEWDIIVLMAAHSQAGMSSAYTMTDELYNKIAADMDKPFLLGMMTSIIYQGWWQNAMLANVRNACNVFPIDIVFPCGTAIYNAQQDETLDAINTHLFSSDTVHLNEGMPCYIAALANVEKIFRTFYPHLSIINDQTRSTAAWLSGKNVPGQQGTVDDTAVTEDNCYLAQRMALLANDYPFDIANRTVTVSYSLGGGHIHGTITDNGGNDQSRINSGTFKKMRHCNLCIHVQPASGKTTLDSVSYTYQGITHNCTITDNAALIVIDDIVDDVAITASAS